MIRQRSSHLQNCKSERMSRRIAIEQSRYAAGMADTEGWQFETCWTTQELRMRIVYARKRSFFYYMTVSLYEQLLRRQNRYGEPLWSMRPNCQLMTKLEIMQILQAQVCGWISAHPGLTHQKKKRESRDASSSQLNQTSWKRTVL